MKMAIVGGTFDKDGGKSSYIVGETIKQFEASKDIDLVCGDNGGFLLHLDAALDFSFYGADALLWMPNIDNGEDKYLPRIKAANPNMVLVSSKNLVGRDYSSFNIVKRLLGSRSTLGLLINKDSGGNYVFSVVDPLGNAWARDAKLSVAIDAMIQRVSAIGKMSRVASKNAGPRKEFELEPEFLDATRRLGEQFTEYVEAVNPARFLGNASTRCCHGFPSARSGNGTVFMSRRNVDKTIISSDEFVEVANTASGDTMYFGDQKPSVDSPVQLRLYERYPNINYIVHGHVYVKGAPFTDGNIPCGFLEELEEVVSKFPDSSAGNFVLNLRGHGCLILASDLAYLTGHEFLSRPVFELARVGEDG